MSFGAPTCCEVLRDIVGRLQLIVEFPVLGVSVWSTPSSRPHSGTSQSLTGEAHGEQGEHIGAIGVPRRLHTPPT